MSLLFYERTGDGGTVELPNDLKDLQLDIDNDIVSIIGTHSGDGRIGTSSYNVGVEKGRSDSYEEIEHDDFQHIRIVERGMWRGNMRISVVTLTEVSE